MVLEGIGQQVCERFRNDKHYREDHIRIINPLPFRHVIGLHTPEMKDIARKLTKTSDAKNVLNRFAVNADHLLHEECMIWGFMINYMKVDLEERLRLIGQFVPSIDNWAVCDAFCGSAKWVKKENQEVILNWLDRYLASAREFDVRFAIVMYKSYFLTDGFIDRIFDKIDTINLNKIHSEYNFASKKDIIQQVVLNDDNTYRLAISTNHNCSKGKCNKGISLGASPYYVRMGTAWLLATALSKYPEKTRQYVNRSSLPDDVIKLYLRKARESFVTRTVPAL